MKLNIFVNKYLLIWHLLYESSVSDEIHKLKQKLWKDYKREYSLVHREKDEILSDPFNFIPNDDLIYNLVENSIYYKKIKLDTNRYRLKISEIWDRNRKKYIKELRDILKTDLNNEYKICVVHPLLDVVETDNNFNVMTIGKKIITNDKDNFLTYLMYKIVKAELSNMKHVDDEILSVVIELAVTNELYTRMVKESKYKIGKKSLHELKQKIYPFWLMYLGVSSENFDKYMVRDGIFFDKTKYKNTDLIQDMDIYSFITFLSKGKKKILNTKLEPIENIKTL